MSNSIANEEEVIKLAKTLLVRIPEIAKDSTSTKTWTHAVWECLGEIAKDREKCEIHPKNGPYKGEFLLDFVVWEEGYGPRIVCESQWQNLFNDIGVVDWAFDKLRCVKGDIKVLVYEWRELLTSDEPPPEVKELLTRYLKDIQLFSPDEAFLFLNFSKNKSAHWWKPEKPGRQDGIQFKRIYP